MKKILFYFILITPLWLTLMLMTMVYKQWIFLILELILLIVIYKIYNSLPEKNITNQNNDILYGGSTDWNSDVDQKRKITLLKKRK